MTQEEQLTILKFIYNKNFLCSPLTNDRADFKFDITMKNIPIELFKIKQRILKREDLKGYDSHTYLGDLITFILPGGNIPRHTDKNSFDGYIHIRFNVFVTGSDMCKTLYDNIPVDTKDRHYVMCRSGIDAHWTEINRNNIPRIALSYGFMLPIQKVTQLYKIPNEYNTPARNRILFRYIYYIIVAIYNLLKYNRNMYTKYTPNTPFIDICGFKDNI
jgi:hypothetical protein